MIKKNGLHEIGFFLALAFSVLMSSCLNNYSSLDTNSFNNSILSSESLNPQLSSFESSYNVVSQPSISYSSDSYLDTSNMPSLEKLELIKEIGGQDGCAYGDYIFSFNDNNSFCVYKYSEDKILGVFELDGGLSPHCNSACFGNEKFSKDDFFPLLYVNAYNNTSLPRGTCYVFRITINGYVFKTKLVQTISISFVDSMLWSDTDDIRPYGNFAIDGENKKMRVYIMRNVIQTTRFFEFELPDLSDGSYVVLREKDIIKYFDVDYFHVIQGNYSYDNKVVFCFGVGYDAAIAVIDIELETVTVIISLQRFGLIDEPEKVFRFDNSLFYGTNTSIYKLTFNTSESWL